MALSRAMPDHAAPKHILIHDEIAAAIVSGTYQPGQQLPTEMELVRTVKASRPTVALRLAGYRDALRQAAIKPSSDAVHFGDPADPAFVKRMLGSRRDRAFVCANDLTAARTCGRR